MTCSAVRGRCCILVAVVVAVVVLLCRRYVTAWGREYQGGESCVLLALEFSTALQKFCACRACLYPQRRAEALHE